MKAKTLNSTIRCSPTQAIEFLSDVQNLPTWHRSFCRSVEKGPEGWRVQTHRSKISVRVLRDDRSGVVDFLFRFAPDFEWLVPTRVLPNGDGSEIILTLIQPDGTSETDYQRHLQWGFEALRELRKKLEQAPRSQQTPAAAESVSADSGPAAEAPEGEPAPFVERRAPAEPGEPQSANPNRLFVRGFPWDWTEEHLKTHFGTAGTVDKAEIARFRRNGKSRGFGFIEMSTVEETQVAIDSLNGSLAGTRKILVRLSRESRPGSPETAEASPAAEAAPQASAPAPEKPAHHQPRPQRHRQEPREPARRRVPRSTGDQHAVIETGGYEFFPRGQKPSETDSAPEAPARSFTEPSPYFEDTGDFENRGNRAPRRGGNRPGRGGHPRGRGRRRTPKPS